MRPEFTKKPEFMRLAAEQKRNQPPLLLELLILILLSIIATVARTLLGLIPQLSWMLSGNRLDAIRALLESTSFENAVLGVQSMLPPWLMGLILVLSFTGGIVAMLYCRIIEKRKLATMGFCRPGVLRHLLLGLGLGLALTAAVTGLAVLFHGVSITGIALRRSLIPLLLLFVLGFVAQGFSDTLLLHGYLGVSLNKRYRLPLCLAGPALAYALLYNNSVVTSFVGVLNLSLTALFAGLLMLRTGDLWSLFGFYGFWNFLQSGLLLQTSPADGDYPCLFTAEILGQNELLTGGDGGLCSSLCATLVLLAGIGILFWQLRGRPDDTAAPVEEA